MNVFLPMKACKTLLAATFGIVTAFQAPQLAAQEVLGSEQVVAGPISTGRVTSVDGTHGTMIIQSTETRGPITFYGMSKARVETSKGQLATLQRVLPGMPVTVYYTPIEGKWHVAKVLIPENFTAPAQPGTELTGSEVKALTSKAANDGDLTTEPGVKARIDDDITTKPGTKDPRDPDITKKTDK